MTPLLLPVGAWAVFAGAGTVDWSPAVNTFLLVVLALIGLYGERARRRDADRVRERVVEARNLTREEMRENTALTAEIHEVIGGSGRSNNLRTRKGDP